MKVIYTIEEAKEALIKSCVSFRPQYFKPFLISDLVSEPRKNIIYKFFTRMLCCAKKSSEGEMTVRITTDSENSNIQYYKLYDSVHVYSRLTIIIEESDGTFSFDVAPF